MSTSFDHLLCEYLSPLLCFLCVPEDFGFVFCCPLGFKFLFVCLFFVWSVDWLVGWVLNLIKHFILPVFESCVLFLPASNDSCRMVKHSHDHAWVNMIMTITFYFIICITSTCSSWVHALHNTLAQVTQQDLEFSLLNKKYITLNVFSPPSVVLAEHFPKLAACYN